MAGWLVGWMSQKKAKQDSISNVRLSVCLGLPLGQRRSQLKEILLPLLLFENSLLNIIIIPHNLILSSSSLILLLPLCTRIPSQSIPFHPLMFSSSLFWTTIQLKKDKKKKMQKTPWRERGKQ